MDLPSILLNLSGMIRDNTLVRFYLLAYLLSWFLWIPLALSNAGLIPLDLPQALFILGAFGPAISALAVTGRYEGWRGVKSLLGRLLIARLPVKWYLLSLLGPFGIVMTVLLILFMFFGPIPDLGFEDPGALTGIFFGSLLVCANEELSWRGFALPRFQKKYKALLSSLITGFLWGGIHIPLFILQPERGGGFQLPLIIPGFIMLCMLLSVIYTWLFNSTRGSVLIATLFHTALNTANELYSSPVHDQDRVAMFIFTGIIFVLSLIIIAFYGTKNLSANPRINK